MTAASESFVRRKIDVDFTLNAANGSFSTGNANTVKLSGHRAIATIQKAGIFSMGGMELSIYGMKLPEMNRLSSLGKLPTLIGKNIVSVSAGDDAAGMSQVFEGTIYQAWSDFQSAPDNIFRVTCFAGQFESVQKIPASSYPGRVDAANIMADLAKQMGLQFENNGVSVTLSTPYYPGTARAQAAACATAGGFNWIIDNGKLAIWPNGGFRAGSVPIISADTGMVGYPTFYSLGLSVTSLYNPAVAYGAKIQVKSILPAANGIWVVQGLSYELAAEVPGGPWFQTMDCTPLG